jgi:hypothetical protein
MKKILSYLAILTLILVPDQLSAQSKTGTHFTESEIVLKTSSGDISGTLTMPEKPEAKLLIIDNMNHILKEAEAYRQKNIATYNNPELPLKQGLVKELVSFIKNKK